MKVLATGQKDEDGQYPIIIDHGKSVGILDEGGSYITIPKTLFTRAAAVLIAEASVE